MNTHTLVQGIDDFLPCVSEKNYLFSWLQIMRAWSTDMAIAVGKSIDGKDGAAITQYLRSILGEVRAVKARALFQAIEDTGLALDRLAQALGNGDDGAAARARRLLQHFSEGYEALLEAPSPRTVYPFVLSADMLRTALVTLAGLLKGVKGRLAGEPSAQVDEEQISIVMPSPVGFADFTEKLQALQDGYTSIGRLFQGGAAPLPLRIAKIESGSMWIWVCGARDPMQVLRGAILASARWIYRSYQDGGTALPLPPAEVATQLVGLEAALRAQGVPVANLGDVLRTVALDVVRCAAVLVRGQPEIEVNGETASVTESSRERFLEAMSGSPTAS